MELHKRTYTLPLDILERFERRVPRGQRSFVVSKIIEDWLDEQQRIELRADVIEGCREMAQVYLDVENDYHPLEEEIEREQGAL